MIQVAFWYYLVQLVLKIPLNLFIEIAATEYSSPGEKDCWDDYYDEWTNCDKYGSAAPRAMMIQSIVGSILLLVKVCILRSNLEELYQDRSKPKKGQMFNFFFITTAIDAAACLTSIVSDVVI